MSGRIPQPFIDDLIGRTDIVELIDSHVTLRKAGREYVACCPFHNEKSPSFTVSPEKQFYHCFGCGAHGTAIGFLMEFARLDFVEAVQELASRAGLPMPQFGDGAGKVESTDAGLYPVLEDAAGWFRRQLREHPRGATAVAYLKERGLDGETAAGFGLGYAPPGWDSLLQALGERHKPEQLLAAGLVIRREQGGGYYDRFRDRIMFPIRDGRGRVIAFGGRVLGDDTPKYLNSPETAVFHKGRELYGLYEARKATRAPERLVVVEGYMDVVMLARHGFTAAVATLGTATTPHHLDRLFRLVPELVFCFDGDRAGRQAAWRALEGALQAVREGRQARFMFLPEGEDPDSLVRKEGKEGFEARLADSVTLSTFFYDGLRQQADTSTIDGRARLVELARPYLLRMAPGVFRHMMTRRLAELTRMDALALERMLGGADEKAPSAALPAARPSARSLPRKVDSLPRKAIRMLLRRPALAEQHSDINWLKDLDIPGATILLEMLDLLDVHPHLNTASILERWRSHEHGRYLARLVQDEALIPPESLDAEFAAVMRALRGRYLDQRIDRLREKSELGEEEKAMLLQLLAEKAMSG
ncbi:MAG: DNA primase [Gammaproteobacteria bacterium]|nr:DNA primase [Gammaproteobacteria bacterium]